MSETYLDPQDAQSLQRTADNLRIRRLLIRLRIIRD